MDSRLFVCRALVLMMAYTHSTALLLFQQSMSANPTDAHPNRSRRMGLMTGVSRGGNTDNRHSGNGDSGGDAHPKARSSSVPATTPGHVTSFASQSDPPPSSHSQMPPSSVLTLDASNEDDGSEGSKSRGGDRDGSKAKTEGKRPSTPPDSPSTSTSTWAVIADFPSVIDSIKTPLLSLSSSFYAYMYAPKIPTPLKAAARGEKEEEGSAPLAV